MGVILGAGLGGVLTTAPVLLIPQLATVLGKYDDPVGMAVFFFVFISLGWLVGIALVGVPAWLLAERRRVTGWPAAALLGASLAPPASAAAVALILIAMAAIKREPVDWPPSTLTWVGLGIIFCILGCLVGLAIWRVAYRREFKRDVADIFG